MAKRYPRPQRWYPQNTEKYVGDINGIVTRSSWERRFFSWCDRTPAVIKYSSEETIIPYISPLDNKVHRYFLDAKIQMKQRDGTLKIYLVEIKPEAQTVMPVKGNKKDKTYLNECMTWETNKAKWQAAIRYCDTKGYLFILLTEKHLGIK